MSISAESYPTELLLQIFRSAVHDEPLRVGGTAVALPISQVCRDWRQIALDLPELWDDVRFPCNTFRTDSSFLEELLARSGTRLLTVVFADSRRVNRHSYSEAFFEQMKKYCDRFRAIYAILPTMYALHEAMYEQTFPVLDHLHVVSKDQSSSFLLENTPALSTLYLEKILFNPQSFHWQPSVRSLHLIKSPYVKIPAPLLHGLHELTIIRSALPFFSSDGPPLALTSLTLDAIPQTGPGRHSANGLLRFLASFHMPHLRHLALGHLRHGCEFSSHFFYTLSPRPVFPVLRSMELTTLPLDDLTPEFYEALPALETLVLVDVDPAPMLAVLRADARLCPALRHFYMDGHLRLR
ncbi:hypothetical protein DFH06DRAFT_1232298 [Mycena polygramma]|nr:hypothetical protein DFH06DRAFT_1232298 [Mycena polygramma]